MADQTTQPAQPQVTQPTDNENASSMKVMYISTDANPFVPTLVPESFKLSSDAEYPFVAVKPDASIKYPKYDYLKHTWIENEASAIGQQVATMNQKLEGFETQVKNYQRTAQQVVDAKTAVDKQVGNLGRLIVAMNQSNGEQSKKLDALTEKLDALLNKNDAQATQPSEGGAQ